MIWIEWKDCTTLIWMLYLQPYSFIYTNFQTNTKFYRGWLREIYCIACDSLSIVEETVHTHYTQTSLIWILKLGAPVFGSPIVECQVHMIQHTVVCLGHFIGYTSIAVMSQIQCGVIPQLHHSACLNHLLLYSYCCCNELY